MGEGLRPKGGACFRIPQKKKRKREKKRERERASQKPFRLKSEPTPGLSQTSNTLARERSLPATGATAGVVAFLSFLMVLWGDAGDPDALSANQERLGTVQPGTGNFC